MKTFLIPAICCLTACSTIEHQGRDQPNSLTFDQKIKNLPTTIKASHPDLAKIHNASTLLVSCVDFRLRDETNRLMTEYFELTDEYDEIAMPGASLALIQHKHKEWSDSLEEFIGLIEKLHHIKRIIFLDHQGCGAYKLLLGAEHVKTNELEEAEHRKVLADATSIIKKKFPKLKVYTLLIGLDGVVKNMDDGK